MSSRQVEETGTEAANFPLGEADPRQTHYEAPNATNPSERISMHCAECYGKDMVQRHLQARYPPTLHDTCS
jgi:hypothetical protein